MTQAAFEATEAVKHMEQNAAQGTSNLCDWNKMTSREQLSIFRAYQSDKSDLPHVEFTFDQEGPHLKEKPGLVCEGGKKLPEDQAHDTVEKLRKTAANPQETISQVNKIQPAEQRQLVLKEMSEKGFPGVVIEKQRVGSGTEYRIMEDRSKQVAEALKHQGTGREVWDRPLASTEAEKLEAARQKATDITETKQAAFTKPILPLPGENQRISREADVAEGELHRKIADLRTDPNREKVLAELEKQGAKVYRDEQGRPVEITFRRQFDPKDPVGSLAEKAAPAEMTIPLNKSYEEMKAEKKEQFYEGVKAAEKIGLVSGHAQDRYAQKDTSTKYWFER